MFTSSFYVFLVAAFGAAGLTNNVVTAYVIHTPQGPTFELVPNSNSSQSSHDVSHTEFNPLALDRNNLTTCPCSVTGYQVPSPTYLTNVQQCVIDAYAIYPSNLESFCQKFAQLYVAIYILPSNRIWSVCAGCSNCYNPGCDIWINIQLNIFGGITIKIYN